MDYIAPIITSISDEELRDYIFRAGTASGGNCPQGTTFTCGVNTNYQS